jgi:DNA helicase IV
MQARALARRCPSGSFTVLGDLAQATGAWIRDSWTELTTHLSASETVVETLTIGYRVPSAALELAARLLPFISPNLKAPTSVRLGAGDPTVHVAGEDSVQDRAMSLASADVGDGRTTAIVVADSSFDPLLDRYTAAGMTVGNGRDGDFSHPLTLVPASSVKGLEFDSVVLLGPTELARSAVDGRRLLYIAMTRCTQVLRLVDDGVLPEGLDHLVPSGPDPDVPEVEAIEGDGQRAEELADPDELDALVELVTRLGDDDRALVMALARRLLQEGTRDSEV